MTSKAKLCLTRAGWPRAIFVISMHLCFLTEKIGLWKPTLPDAQVFFWWSRFKICEAVLKPIWYKGLLLQEDETVHQGVQMNHSGPQSRPGAGATGGIWQFLRPNGLILRLFNFLRMLGQLCPSSWVLFHSISWWTTPRKVGPSDGCRLEAPRPPVSPEQGLALRVCAVEVRPGGGSGPAPKRGQPHRSCERSKFILDSFCV